MAKSKKRKQSKKSATPENNPLDRFATVTSLAAAVAAGDVAAVEVADAALARIRDEDFDPDAGGSRDRLNCFLGLEPEKVRERAAAIDAKRAAGEPLGPLAGVPVGIKDNISLAGSPLTCASKLLAGYTAPYDAHVIERLLAADAIPVGRLNMDEFAKGSSGETSAYFPARNPYDPTRVPGGSSSGSAAAVGAGLLPAALGSDTGGSIRQPASLTGTVGLKPTYGRVSRYGLVAFGSSLDQIGPLTRTVEDAARVFAAIAGHDSRDATSAPRPVEDPLPTLTQGVEAVRVGLPKQTTGALDGVEPAVVEAMERAAKALEAAGAVLVDVDLPHSQYAISAYYLLATSETSANLARFDGVRYGARRTPGDDDGEPRDVPPGPHSPLLATYLTTRGAGFGDEVKRRIVLGAFALRSGYHDKYFRKAAQVRTLIQRDFIAALGADAAAKSGSAPPCDVILTPTSPTVAFPLGAKLDDPLSMYMCDIFAAPVSLAGVPAISLPVGLDSAGLPIGAQLIGPMYGEARVLRVAATLERELGRIAPPTPAAAG
jgi:aspartyl-tRNA(Asn)/glutamyl-tRNA(Gln) amidotransferase subunit A